MILIAVDNTEVDRRACIQGTYGDIYNFPVKEYEAALDQEELEEEEEMEDGELDGPLEDAEATNSATYVEDDEVDDFDMEDCAPSTVLQADHRIFAMLPPPLLPCRRLIRCNCGDVQLSGWTMSAMLTPPATTMTSTPTAAEMMMIAAMKAMTQQMALAAVAQAVSLLRPAAAAARRRG